MGVNCALLMHLFCIKSKNKVYSGGEEIGIHSTQFLKEVLPFQYDAKEIPYPPEKKKRQSHCWPAHIKSAFGLSLDVNPLSESAGSKTEEYGRTINFFRMSSWMCRQGIF